MSNLTQREQAQVGAMVQKALGPALQQLTQQVNQLAAAVGHRQKHPQQAQVLQNMNQVDARQIQRQQTNGLTPISAFARKSAGLPANSASPRQPMVTRSIRDIARASSGLPAEQPQQQAAMTTKSFARQTSGLQPEPSGQMIQKSYSFREAARRSMGLPPDSNGVHHRTYRPDPNGAFDVSR